MKKHLIYGKPFDLVHVMEEAGDKAWYIALILDAGGFRMSEAMRHNIAKLKARYPEGFTEERALNRDLTAERKALHKPCACGHSIVSRYGEGADEGLVFCRCGGTL